MIKCFGHHYPSKGYQITPSGHCGGCQRDWQILSYGNIKFVVQLTIMIVKLNLNFEIAQLVFEKWKLIKALAVLNAHIYLQ